VALHLFAFVMVVSRWVRTTFRLRDCRQ
jgi:hypothetical protein